ncbi:MAG: hypothetical protein EAZ70_10545 [Runella slithyformis]|nr:MAG: hypothetical protein EAY79_10475 [Runella slithyformis]TAF25275.1 MAG: hypothetical protein EAZ70_10545 [Runella slithyformis]TAF44434.1 MAG: hypothetical protein EAZ63_12375 [Runella slithyformis]TAF80140.1 MAG: hypothetical protein EAZ50_09630 [Runella slithyformis]
MSLLANIKSYFSRENMGNDPSLISFNDLDSPLPLASEPLPTVANVPTMVPQTTLPTAVVPNVPNLPAIAPVNVADWPVWLDDESLLRDEGVIFGLSSSKPDEKVAMIRTYFAHQSADLEREVEQHGERIQELNLFIEQKENRIEELKTKKNTLESRQAEGEHQLPRTVVGLVFSVAMCVGNYYLIEDTLRPLYGNSQFIAVGVFLAGMFNLFGRVSLFHDTNSSVSWRRLLEEVGMPLAAALFVFVQALQQQPVLRAVALLIFVFFLFLFAGKLLLSNITLLRNDLRIWLTGRSLETEKTDKTQNWDEETTQLQNQIDELRVQKWHIVPQLNRAEAQLTRLNTRRDMLIKSFESEFWLARQLRDKLTDQQIRQISGNI